MELTNHTYLRSRVDMQLADSLRMKASNKISSGVIGNARENAGGFSAGIRFKSNQYLLQSRRANIQNSLSYLEVQRNAIMEARDIMERIALTKIKFDSPTLNQTDRNNLNLEFMELTDELISLREKKFNGVSLFTPTATASSDLFGSSRTNLETGSGADNGVGISQHVIDYQDVRNIYDAGDGVRRGKAGLNVINFEIDPVQRQVERVVLSGSIADGDVFTLKLNELSSIREVESTHTISITADTADENLTVLSSDPDGVANSGDEAYDFTQTYVSIRDKLINAINTQAATGKNGQFVKATADGNNALLITSEGEGDPFDLFEVSSSNSVGQIFKSNDDQEANLGDNNITPGLTGAELNDAEERTLTLDFRHNDPDGTGGPEISRNTGSVVTAGDQIRVNLNGQNIIYAPSNVEIGSYPVNLTDPTNYEDAALFMLTGLQTAINSTAGLKVQAEAPVISAGVGATMVIRSEERGVPFNATTGTENNPLTISKTVNQGQVDESGSEVQISMTGRESAVGDGVRILKGGNVIATFQHGTHFNNFSELRDAINANANLEATLSGSQITITDANPDPVNGQADPGGGAVRKQPENTRLTIRQIQTIDSGSVLAINAAETLFAAKASNFTDLSTTATSGSGNNNLKVDFNINSSTGAVEAASLAVGTGVDAGSGYAKNDTFRVNKSDLGDTEGGNITFRVDSVTGNVTALSSNTASVPGLVDLAATTVATSTNSANGAGLTLNVEISGGVLTVNSRPNEGSQYVAGDTVTIAGGLIGGTNGVDDVTFTVGTAGTAVSAISHISGTAQTTWSMTGLDLSPPGGPASAVQISASAGRDGVITVNSITNNGSGYSLPGGATQALNLNGGGLNVNKNFTITDVEEQFTNAESVSYFSGGNVTANDQLGNQFVAAGADTDLSDSIDVNNNVGDKRNIEVTVGADMSAGQIAPGDRFTITVTEVLHPDEDAGSWPENGPAGEGDRTGSPHSFSASVSAAPGHDQDTVAANLKAALDSARSDYISANSLADDDLPEIGISANTITLASKKEGEDYDISLAYSSSADNMTGTGNGNLPYDPAGAILPSNSYQKNISPFSVTKSISYFEEMLAQNEAETSRLMKAMEHLEDSMVHNEDALSKVQDTDYSQASVEQIRNSVKMQMANNVIGKSMRMNDLLIDLTTKHHRGSVLNAQV